MTVTHDRAQEIITTLAAAGVRATTDPSAVTPPCVLILPPDRRYEGTMCGFAVTWTLVALAPGAQGADRSAWGLLDELVDAVAQAVPETVDAQLVAYTLAGVSYPSYLIRVEENL